METTKITYLDQKSAQKTDEELMNDLGFTIETLMELAGVSIAQAVYDCSNKYHNSKIKNVLVISGPGNNGGDGYVAARQLKMLGIDSKVMIVKNPEKPLYQGLVKTCEANNIEIIDFNESDKYKNSFVETVDTNYDLVIDAIFGFSFQGPIRKPYDDILANLKKVKAPIFSVDIPSGWDVEKGNVVDTFSPEYVISLTLPKLCMKEFKGKHYLGGRFIPKKMIDKYGWVVPPYQGIDHYVEITGL